MLAVNCIPTILSFCRIPLTIGSACKMYKSGATGHPCLMDRDIGKYFDKKRFVDIEVLADHYPTS